MTALFDDFYHTHVQHGQRRKSQAFSAMIGRRDWVGEVSGLYSVCRHDVSAIHVRRHHTQIMIELSFRFGSIGLLSLLSFDVFVEPFFPLFAAKAA